MKVAIFGDCHGYAPGLDVPTAELMVSIVGSIDADLVLQVGDMCSYKPFPKPVYWIYGNRDSISMIKASEQGKAGIENLFLIKTGKLLTLSIAGEEIKISGLNGAYDPIYYDHHREELGDDGLGYFVEEDVQKCLHLRGIDIFLAHGCPSGLGFGREPDHGVPQIMEILDEVRPRCMLCGHAHFFHQAEYSGCRIYSLAEAKEEYYLLDTISDSLGRVAINPGNRSRDY